MKNIKHINEFAATDDSYDHPYIYKLATILHDSRCRYNHTDGCSWYYEEDWYRDNPIDIKKWNEREHSRWFKMATKIFDQATLAEIEEYLNTYKEKQKINRKINEFHKKWGI